MWHTVGKISELDDRIHVPTSRLDARVPENIDVAADAQWKHGGDDVAGQLDDQYSP